MAPLANGSADRKIAATNVTHMTMQGRFITDLVKQPGVTTSSPAAFTCARRDCPTTAGMLKSRGLGVLDQARHKFPFLLQRRAADASM